MEGLLQREKREKEEEKKAPCGEWIKKRAQTT